MVKEFYDRKVRPNIMEEQLGSWTTEELKRVCYNCGKHFGQHRGYKCQYGLQQSYLEKIQV